MQIKFFLRKRFPEYFSIEQIFSAICQRMSQQYESEDTCRLDEVPWYFSPSNFFKNISYIRKNQSDVNHITGDIHYAILGCSRSNFNVLTIHDCVILERYRKWDPRYWLFRTLWYELPMLKADLITVVSEKTKTELIGSIWAGKRKIRVVNNFVDPVFRFAPATFNTDRPALLFIGSTENKNLNRVLEAIRDLPCRLEIIGKISGEQKSFIEKHQLDVHTSSRLTMEEVYKKYEACDMVLFPSTYEGFGMLIVEAGAVGRPVLTSDLSPMREVANGSAALIDPYDIASIRNGILRIIADKNYRDDLVEKGRINAKRFDLDSVVKTYHDLYRQGKSNA